MAKPVTRTNIAPILREAERLEQRLSETLEVQFHTEYLNPAETAQDIAHAEAAKRKPPRHLEPG